MIPNDRLGPPIPARPSIATDDNAHALRLAHIEAGRIGASPPPAPEVVARRIAFSQTLLGRRLARREGGAA